MESSTTSIEAVGAELDGTVLEIATNGACSWQPTDLGSEPFQVLLPGRSEVRSQA